MACINSPRRGIRGGGGGEGRQGQFLIASACATHLGWCWWMARINGIWHAVSRRKIFRRINRPCPLSFIFPDAICVARIREKRGKKGGKKKNRRALRRRRWQHGGWNGRWEIFGGKERERSAKQSDAGDNETTLSRLCRCEGDYQQLTLRFSTRGDACTRLYTPGSWNEFLF